MPNDHELTPPSSDKSKSPEVLPPDSPRLPAPRYRGQFPAGQSGNPKGRPPNIYNQSSVLIASLLEESAKEITEAAIAAAKNGNALAIKLCLDRLAPPPQTRTVRITLPTPSPEDLSSGASLVADHAALLTAVAEGEITPLEGESVSNIIEARRRSLDFTHVDHRMDTLEDSIENVRRNGSRRPKIHWASNPPAPREARPTSEQKENTDKKEDSKQ